MRARGGEIGERQMRERRSYLYIYANASQVSTLEFFSFSTFRFASRLPFCVVVGRIRSAAASELPRGFAESPWWRGRFRRQLSPRGLPGLCGGWVSQ